MHVTTLLAVAGFFGLQQLASAAPSISLEARDSEGNDLPQPEGYPPLAPDNVAMPLVNTTVIGNLSLEIDPITNKPYDTIPLDFNNACAGQASAPSNWQCNSKTSTVSTQQAYQKVCERVSAGSLLAPWAYMATVDTARALIIFAQQVQNITAADCMARFATVQSTCIAPQENPTNPSKNSPNMHGWQNLDALTINNGAPMFELGSKSCVGKDLRISPIEVNPPTLKSNSKFVKPS